MILTSTPKSRAVRYRTKLPTLPWKGTAGQQYPEYLETISRVTTRPSKRLSGYRLIIIGAGPAGLSFARAAAMQGAHVQVLEKAGDPRTNDPGYTNRSFNLTLDDVGRTMLGDERVWQGGVWLRGRAIHNFKNTGETRYADYGSSVAARLVSIPRPVLRQNLCDYTQTVGAKIIFNSTITAVDCEAGTVRYKDAQGRQHTLDADLIVFGDGVHSLADNILTNEYGARVDQWLECRSYVTGLISPAMNRDLSLEHIHFWHEPKTENFTVGIPNADGSVACLIVSPFEDCAVGDQPFGDTQQCHKLLRKDFPRLWASAPELASALTSQYSGQFCYKAVDRFRVGKKGVLVGDSGGAFPPWAGYGANQAMFSAVLLVHLLTRNSRNFKNALHLYERQQLNLADRLKDFVSQQGDFLSECVAKDPAGRSEPALGPLIWQAFRATQHPLKRALR